MMILKPSSGQLPRVIPLRRLQQSPSQSKALDKGIFDDDDPGDDDDVVYSDLTEKDNLRTITIIAHAKYI